MKNHLITLLALGATTSCLGMSFLTDNKEIIIKHQDTVHRTTFSDTRYITFSVNKIGAEIYDIKDDKIIKTVNNLAWWPGSPILNDYTSSLVAFERQKENTYLCSLYNLEKNTEKIFRIPPISRDLYLQNYFVLLGKSLLTASVDAKSYNVYTIKNDTSKSVHFDEEISRYYPSTDKNHLAVFLKNNELYYNDIFNMKKELVSKKSNVSKFSPDSTMLAFFDQENSVVTLYDTKNQRVIDQNRTKEAIIQLLFPTNTTIWFSANRQNYVIWDIKNNTINTLDLGSRSYQKQVDIPLNNFLHFETLPDHSVYNLVTNKLFTLKEKGHGSYLIFNNDETYAAYSTGENLAVLYETKNWQRVTSITFENGSFNPFPIFSPCGQFLAVTSIGAHWIKIYDIKKDTIIFESAWQPPHPWVQFHTSGIIAFRSSPTNLVLYDYKNHKESGLEFEEEIGYYAIKDDIITVSYGSTTKLFYFSNLEFEDCPENIDYSKLYESQEKTVLLENTWLKNQASMRFYTDKIVACQSDESTIALYNHSTNKKAEVKRDQIIAWFDIKDDLLIISYETKQEYIPLKDISFEDCKDENKKDINEAENKGYRCIIA